VGARFTIYGAILDRFGPFLDAFASLLVPPPFALHVVGRLDSGIAGDAVEKACEHVPWWSRVKVAGKYRSSGATTTFMEWNDREELREDNGHVIGERERVESV
jgi:hypothetical protein